MSDVVSNNRAAEACIRNLVSQLDHIRALRLAAAKKLVRMYVQAGNTLTPQEVRLSHPLLCVVCPHATLLSRFRNTASCSIMRGGRA
jgi:hypothetical protein